MATGTHSIFPLRESDISRIARLPNHAQGFFTFAPHRETCPATTPNCPAPASITGLGVKK